MPEAWLRGPVPGITPYLMPAAHALIQAREEMASAAARLEIEQLWARPGGGASVGFHLRHIAGSIDRLLTYARGEALSETQHRALAGEGEPGNSPEAADALIERAGAAVEQALDVLRATPASDLLEPRSVGRAGLPSNVIGLLFHVAEHTQRHAGQVVTLAKIVGSSGPAGDTPSA